MGYLLEPGVYSQPRPFERFPMPLGSLAPDEDGRLRIVLCEPMEGSLLSRRRRTRRLVTARGVVACG